MLQILRRGGAAMETVESAAEWRLDEDVVWIELIHPSREEEVAVERALGVGLPTREEMAEIEPSSRLYHDNGAAYMTAILLCGSDKDVPVPGPVTFVLIGDRLVTIRYVFPQSFPLFVGQAERQPELSRNGVTVFLGLLEIIVDRAADLLERISGQAEAMSRAITGQDQAQGFKPLLTRLARTQSVNGMAHDSLVSLGRMLSFAILAPQLVASKEARGQLKSLQRDVQSLNEHSSYVSGNLSFLLNAALGLINVQQNEVTKVFSIYAVVLLPPTLLATWWGMNFHQMPELDWPLFYPWGPLLLMVLSVALPFLWFKRRGWL